MNADDGNPSDALLIQHARAGNREAFRQLLERHYDMIFRFAYKNLGHRQDAADAAQQVCLRLPEALAGFRGDSRFSTWLYQVTLNVCRDQQKKVRGYGAMEGRYLEYEHAAQADRRDDDRKRAELYRLVQTLEPPLPETVLLVVAEGLSHAEAGRVLGCAESTISWRLHEARKRLKERFAQTRSSFEGDPHAG